MRYIAAFASLTLLLSGCAADRPAKRENYSLIAEGPPGSSVRLYRSSHHLLYTTLDEPTRIAGIISTLEAAYDECVAITGVRPSADAVPQSVFVFAHRSEWEAFTRARAGAAAGTYLQLDRGGYTLGRACAVRDQGEHDTLTVLAHEELHLFVATHFQARPPPFIEEGLATLLERVREDGGRASIDLENNASRANRLAVVIGTKESMPLRQLLAMHAGNVIGLSGQDVDAFYAQAWAFARFLREGESGKYRPALLAMLNDSAGGALSSASLRDNPQLVERYLGVSVDQVQGEYDRFARRLSP